VAEAVFEGVLPRSANDILPHSKAGIIVSVVDKLDSLVGLAAAGCLPTAGADRYGLRRISYGLLQSLIGNKVRTSLSQLVSTAAAVQPIPVSDATQQEIVEFATKRLEQYILDQGTHRSFGFGVSFHFMGLVICRPKDALMVWV
jgi:glycyl-tRNA synthetase